MNSTDSFIFLAAINALTELAFWKTDTYLIKLVELFIKWDENSTDKDLIYCCKIGEALAKLFKELGTFLNLYKGY